MAKPPPLSPETKAAIMELIKQGVPDKEILALYPMNRVSLWRQKSGKNTKSKRTVKPLPITEGLLFSLFERIMMDAAMGNEKIEVVLPATYTPPKELFSVDILPVEIRNTLTGEMEHYIIRQVDYKNVYKLLDKHVEMPLTLEQIMMLKAESRKLDKEMNRIEINVDKLL
jgi:hypothetical protein